MGYTDVEMSDAAMALDHDGHQSEAGSVVATTLARPTANAPSAASDVPSASRPRGRGHHILHRRRSVYDAVAGRVRLREPRPPKWPGQPIKYRDTMLAPEEALFRAANAPDRYEETDTYFAHENLPDGVLPPSDLVKAVHHYVSHYYEALARRQGIDVSAAAGQTQKQTGMTDTAGRRPKPRRLVDERSMDETALLAFGILLEEAARDMLGADGALVLTEAAEVVGDEKDEEEGVVVEGGDGGGSREQDGKKDRTGDTRVRESGLSGKNKAGKRMS